MRFQLLALLSVVLAVSPAVADDLQPEAPPAAATLERKVADLERRVGELLAEIRELRRQLEITNVEGPNSSTSAMSWGGIKDGLQVGLALRPADRHTYDVGDEATFLVKVRNTTNHPIDMPYLAVEPAALVGCSVLDARGERPAKSGPVHLSVGGRAINKLSLAAGEEVEFASPKLIFGPAAESSVQPQPIVQAGAGEFHVSCNSYYLNADETGNYLTSGAVKVEVNSISEKQP